MTKTLIKPTLFSNKNKIKIKPQIEKNTSTLHSYLQTFKQKSLSSISFSVYKRALKISYY